jgi:dissimilatory sulfite reductase (desulfoviridin) alpha/beta subunit
VYMSIKVPKSLKNPALRDKFKPGQTVSIPTRIAYRHTSKLGVLRRPVLGRVVSAGDRQVDKHYRFAVDISWIRGVMEVWEEWQLEEIHFTTPNQLNAYGTQLPDYLKYESESKSEEGLPAGAGNVAEASA